jgi:shikimate dehydrogenase
MMESEKSYRMELTGVFGYPVDENPTVVMIEAAFRALDLPWRYLNLKVPPESLPAAVGGLRAMGFRGINLTIPHKCAVIPLLDEVAADARIMGAVNTVYVDGDRLVGANTDGKGFLRALSDDARVNPAGRKFVILGAGGAARAISVELALAGAREIVIVNRGEARGRELLDLLARHTPVRASYQPWNTNLAIPADADVLVNATSIGLYPAVDEAPSLDYATIRPGMVVCDVIPNPPRTRFLEAAQARGARTLDGLGMLVYQGAIALKLWTGRDAPVEVMKSALAAEFADSSA